MKSIMSIGELLIDFIPDKRGLKMSEVHSFIKKPGGAPANVCVQAAKLNHKSIFVGQVGKDGFGDFLKQTLIENKVDTTYLYQTDDAHTALAFVTLTKSGEREFAFYRNPSADQLLDIEQVSNIDVDQSIFHFCSLSLDDYPLKEAVKKLIFKHKAKGNLISFDPNLRLSLFKNEKAYRDVILEYIPYADILKVSDDELFFITNIKNEKEAINYLFNLNISHLVITRGSLGVTYVDKNRTIDVSAFKVETIDTTGAGDSWIGAFLSQIANYSSIEILNNKELEHILMYANAAAALTTTRQGAISALPNHDEIMNLLENR